ncbi:hypothetical protein, conserved [Trypanosoma brucei brucei TREU927]|uniref:DUF155 domain-containing protein n=1 Tax=Trypanosoma brucei brucei (strain 927/4 GUTat10.1) TaxID=185431 RepID=Q386E2_TRYB2|nr:hypothetical protein, conserved [Trypanosoma brucei brucei TREU927]EAN79339.1 hypothetical protein, conserved [Trypanosoma brucei brucei TREU927]
MITSAAHFAWCYSNCFSSLRHCSRSKLKIDMTDSESDAGFIQLRNRLLELLYSSNSSFSVDQIARILAVDESKIVNELKHVAHNDVAYDEAKGIVQVRADMWKPRSMKAGDVVIDTAATTTPAAVADVAPGSVAVEAYGGGTSGGGVERRNINAGGPLTPSPVLGSPLNPMFKAYPKYGSHNYYPNRGMRVLAPKGALRKTKYRRTGDAETLGKGGGMRDEGTSPTGRVGYVCVADEFRLSEMESYYCAQGYYAKFAFDVLHIRFSDREMKAKDPRGDGLGAGGSGCQDGSGNNLDNSSTNPAGGEKVTDRTTSSAFTKLSRSAGFDLFVFGYGAVVWWGFDQRFFKIVENDFMLSSSPISNLMVNRYATHLVNANYPVWCTYNLARKESLEPDEHFREQLRFDHFLIPCGRGDFSTGNVCMLCVSHALAQSAKIDYLELKVQELAERCSPLPRELRENGRVTIAERRLLQLRGEVLSYRLMLKSGSNLMDEPDFFWENAYLKPVFQATKEYFEIAERVEALDNKLDAANEILSMIAEEFSQRHGARLEWIVIWLVFVEVILGVLELIINIKPWVERGK